MKLKAKIIAIYLPQYHPIPENDLWWGKGFTEWSNVAKAKPLFKGHYQPRLPADLGYYDLRVPEARKAQADMAREYGVAGFCYWHYWFGEGKQLIERPFNEVLESGEPDFPFCLAWANETWKGFVHGLKNRNILIEQKYPGVDDFTAHFMKVLPAFKDKRYIEVDGKPLFMIYKPFGDEKVTLFMDTWRTLALEHGLNGIHFVGHCNDHKYSAQQILDLGFDSVNTVRLDNYLANHRSLTTKIVGRLNKILRGVPLAYPYKIMSKYFIEPSIDSNKDVFPSIIPGWDHSARSGREGLVMTNVTPELFDKHVKDVLEVIEHKEEERKIIFIKSWNEWAEGNYMEPDIKWGKAFLEVLKKNIIR